MEEDKITNRDEENITYKKGEKISNKEYDKITDYKEDEIEILAEFEHSSKDEDIDMDEDISDDDKNLDDDDDKNEISSINEDMDMEISEDEEDLDEATDSEDVVVLDSPSKKHKLGNEDFINEEAEFEDSVDEKKNHVGNMEHKENTNVNEATYCVEEAKATAVENQESMEEEQECLLNDNDLTNIEIGGNNFVENQHDSVDDEKEGEGQESVPFEKDTMKLEPCLVEEVEKTTKQDTKVEEQKVGNKVSDLVADDNYLEEMVSDTEEEEYESMDGDQDLEEQASLGEKQDYVNEAEQKKIDFVGEERESIDEEQDYVDEQQALEDNEQDLVVIERDCSEGDLVEKQQSKSDEGSTEWTEGIIQTKDDKKYVEEKEKTEGVVVKMADVIVEVEEELEQAKDVEVEEALQVKV